MNMIEKEKNYYCHKCEIAVVGELEGENVYCEHCGACVWVKDTQAWKRDFNTKYGIGE